MFNIGLQMTSADNNDTRAKILIIDDEPSVLNLLDSFLNNSFQITKADTAKGGIQSIQTSKPDLIIMDVNLGSENGIEVAKSIKLDPINKDIPIILISGAATKEDRMEGYEAGVIDFVSKPFYGEEILLKVKLHLEFASEVQEKNTTIDETRQMAFTAMSQSGEIGQVLHFMRDSFECNTFDMLAERILEYMETQNLKTSIIIKTNPPLYYTHDEELVQIDKEILDRLNVLERIIDFGKRTIYNFEYISILVKNMPLDDEGFYGRIKDNVCLILEAANAKIIGIDNEKKLQSHNDTISRAIENSKSTLKEIEVSFQKNAHKNSGIMMQLKEQIEDSFLQLGLTETQETEISNLIDNAEKKSTELYDTGLQIEDKVKSLVNEFSNIS